MAPPTSGSDSQESAGGDPRRWVRLHEVSLTQGRRRRLGAHYTPVELADRLVNLAFTYADLDVGELPRLVCDPSCGAGSILVSVADELLSRGATPSEVLGLHLIGCDIDPGAAEAARRSLFAWAVAAGEPNPPEPRIIEADALAMPTDFADVDVIVGNPPFASPLSADVARRRKLSKSRGVGNTLSAAVAASREPPDATGGIRARQSARDGAYVDDSALHLRAAVELVAPGGVVCLLQPQSLLASRDAAPVRLAVSELAVLRALWASGDDIFEDAAVRVCAPVLVRRRWPDTPGASGMVSSAVLWEDEPPLRVSFDGTGSWGPLLAGAVGTPQVVIPGGSVSADEVARVGDLAHCTAGFRDEFYALTSVARESDVHGSVPHGPGAGALDGAGDGTPDDAYMLVTSGMVDPGMLRWGTGSWRLAGMRFAAPVADPGLLEETSSRVARWSAARAVPKVLVASQTNVLEAAVDRRGRCVPVTPVVSVEPTGGCSPAALAAMLSAPSNSALLATGAAGTGRSSTALRVGASAVARLLVSADPDVWSAAEELWEAFESHARAASRVGEWFMIGVELDRLLGMQVDESTVTWWVERLPGRLVHGSI